MTTPATNRTTLGRPVDQDQIDDQALTYERAVEAAAVAALLAALVAIQTRAALSLPLGRPLGWLARELRAVQVQAAQAVTYRLGEGLRLGAGQAAADARLTGLPPLRPDRAMTATVAGMDTAAKAALREAAHLAGRLPMATETDLTAVMTKAMAAANTIKADARWVANRAVNAGTQAVAEAAGADVVWVAERGACLVCQALSGEVVTAGGTFDVSATFGRPMPMFPVADPAPLVGPPRHPGCRCSLRLVTGANQRLPAALRREAQRSVVRGWSNYDSEPARLLAADRLLSHPTLLPKTVTARARHDVKRRAFSDRRNQLLPALPAGR